MSNKVAVVQIKGYQNVDNSGIPALSRLDLWLIQQCKSEILQLEASISHCHTLKQEKL